MSYVAAYVAALAVFVIIDMMWLGTMVERIYRPALGDILASGVNLAPAIVFYLLYPAGLVFFAVAPALGTGHIPTALICGSLFGLFTYGTYDLTNHATLRHWSATVTVVDMAWGGVLGGLSAASATWIVMRFVHAA